MKNKKQLIMILAGTVAVLAVAALCVFGGKKTSTPVVPQTPATTPVAGTTVMTADLGIAGTVNIPANAPEIQDKLTWEKINSVTQKTSTMTKDEARDLCVEFFVFQKQQALWTPSENIEYIRNLNNVNDSMSAGTIYGGLPYITNGNGNIYRLMDFMDPETGVVDVRKYLRNPSATDSVLPYKQMQIFGNQCSYTAYWAWGRVMNSAEYKNTETMTFTEDNGFIWLGALAEEANQTDASGTVITTWKDLKGDVDGTTYEGTNYTAHKVGEQKMYSAYADMLKADGMVQYAGGGHVIMCYENPTVSGTDGNIDGDNSYVYIIDQNQPWIAKTNDSGDSFQYKGFVEQKKTFTELYNEGYLPFTFAELTGDDPIEDTDITFSLSNRAHMTYAELMASTITCNYSISDVYVRFYDDAGEEIYRYVVRALEPSTMEVKFASVQPADTGTNLIRQTLGEKPTDGAYNVEIELQLATGERPTIYMGTVYID